MPGGVVINGAHGLWVGLQASVDHMQCLGNAHTWWIWFWSYYLVRPSCDIDSSFQHVNDS